MVRLSTYIYRSIVGVFALYLPKQLFENGLRRFTLSFFVFLSLTFDTNLKVLLNFQTSFFVFILFTLLIYC